MGEQGSWSGKIFRFLNKLGTAILINLVFLVSCLPVVTIGQAWCGLMSAVRYIIRGESWWEGYKFGFKTRFWRGTISWCIMLALNVYLLLDVHYNFAEGYTVPLIASAAVFSLSAMMTTTLLLLNVYIPTGVYQWVRNAASMVFQAPLQLFGSALACWLPVLLFLLLPNIFLSTILLYIAIYEIAVGFGVTMLMKQTLVLCITEARANGTLLAEEGRRGENQTQGE